MVQEPARHAAARGPALIRLLARLTETDVAEPGQLLPDRLSQWLGWADAIALSATLNSAPLTAPAGRLPDDDGSGDYARTRAALENAITGHQPSPNARQRMHPRAAIQRSTPAPAVVEFASYRRRYASVQQTMETSIAGLRGRLRTVLRSRTPEMARLAVLDAAMEQALSEREQYLLAGVPALLQGHFERLQRAEQEALAQDPALRQGAVIKPGAWLEVFRQDMQRVLLAELDIRLQPVEGLLSALRACQPRTL